MTTALEAATRHLDELAKNQVPHRDKPSAFHHGLITQLVHEIDRLQARNAELEARLPLVEFINGYVAVPRDEYDRLQDELERLRAEVEQLRVVAFRAKEYLHLHKKPYETAARRLLRKSLTEADTQAAPCFSCGGVGTHTGDCDL